MAGTGRRGLLFGAACVALVAGWQRWAGRPAALEFTPLRSASGWSFAMAGQASGISGAEFATIGLEKGPEPLAMSRLTGVVYSRKAAGRVPLAVFSDFFCPYCRELIPRIKALEAEGAIVVSWHELPLLGPLSVWAARALVAADLQDGYAAFHGALLRRGARPQTAWYGPIAEEAGLDVARLMADMDGPEVAARLADSAAAAARLGITATPGVVTGRKVVLGALQVDRLRDLIADG